jgi:hypothetical protein
MTEKHQWAFYTDKAGIFCCSRIASNSIVVDAIY